MKQVCQVIANGGKRIFDKQSKVPYVVNKRQWISYDDVDSVELKVCDTRWQLPCCLQIVLKLALNLLLHVCWEGGTETLCKTYWEIFCVLLGPHKKSIMPRKWHNQSLLWQVICNKIQTASQHSYRWRESHTALFLKGVNMPFCISSVCFTQSQLGYFCK